MSDLTQDELPDAWLKTRLFAFLDGREVDFDRIDGDKLGLLGGLGVLCLITAFNPMGVTVSDDENAQADIALKALLERRGHDLHRAVGRAADGDWEEPGYLVRVPDEREAIALGVEAKQLAVFIVGPDEIAAVTCFAPFERFVRPRG